MQKVTCAEQNFDAVEMLSCTRHMQRSAKVTVMSFHERTFINHELNTVELPADKTEFRFYSHQIDIPVIHFKM